MEVIYSAFTLFGELPIAFFFKKFLAIFVENNLPLCKSRIMFHPKKLCYEFLLNYHPNRSCHTCLNYPAYLQWVNSKEK